MSKQRTVDKLMQIVRVFSLIQRNQIERIEGFIPDALYLHIQYFFRMKKRLNLHRPKTLSEKLQWLKLHDRQSKYTELVDKQKVKRIVAEKIGEEHVLPLLGCWNSPYDIDLKELPEAFVLKCNHDSGSAVVVRRDISDFKSIQAVLQLRLKRNYYLHTREWPYKNIERKIIAEPFIPSLGRSDSYEYKLTCMNGRVVLITICQGIAHSTNNVRTNDFYDRDFHPLKIICYYQNSEAPLHEKPEFMDEMIQYAEKLATGIPYIRVDFYYLDKKILFGEMTFFTWGGYTKFVPESTDLWLGEKLQLPEVEC